MKKEWKSPQLKVEEYVANEYVAACYKIYCETPNSNSRYYKVYYDTNGNGQLDAQDKLAYSNRMGFTGCGKYHYGVVRGSAPAANGFVTKNSDKTVEPVFVWEEKLGGGTVDVHVMNPGGKGYVDISSKAHPNASA